MSGLAKQRTEGGAELLVCLEHCWDNTDNYNREYRIAEALNANAGVENVDHRTEDWSWFASSVEGF